MRKKCEFIEREILMKKKTIKIAWKIFSAKTVKRYEFVTWKSINENDERKKIMAGYKWNIHNPEIL